MAIPPPPDDPRDLEVVPAPAPASDAIPPPPEDPADLDSGEAFEEPSKIRAAGQAASYALKLPGRGVRGVAVGLERLARGDDMGRAAERAAEATKPDYEAIPGERKSAAIGQAIGDLPLWTAAGAGIGPAAAAPVVRGAAALANAVPAAAGIKAAVPFLASGSIGAAVGGLDAVLSDMAAKGEVAAEHVKAAMTGGALIGAGLHIGVDAALEGISSRVTLAFVQRAGNELRALKRSYEKRMGIATPENPQVVRPGVVPQDLQEAVILGKMDPEAAAQEAGERFQMELQGRSSQMLQDPVAAADAGSLAVENLIKSGIPRPIAEAQVAQALSRAAVQSEAPPQPQMTDPVPPGVQLPPGQDLQPQPASAEPPIAPGAATPEAAVPPAPLPPEARMAAAAPDLPPEVQQVMAQTGIEDPELAWALAAGPESRAAEPSVPAGTPEGPTETPAGGQEPPQQAGPSGAIQEIQSQRAPLDERIAAVANEVKGHSRAEDVLSGDAQMHGLDPTDPALPEAVINAGRGRMKILLDAMESGDVTDPATADFLRRSFGRELAYEAILRNHIGAAEGVPSELLDAYDEMADIARQMSAGQKQAEGDLAAYMGKETPLRDLVRQRGLNKPAFKAAGHLGELVDLPPGIWRNKGGLNPDAFARAARDLGATDGEDMNAAFVRLREDLAKGAKKRPEAGAGQPPAPPPPSAPPVPGSPGQPRGPRSGIQSLIAKATGLDRALPQNEKAALIKTTKAEAAGPERFKTAEQARIHESDLAKLNQKLEREKAAHLEESKSLHKKIREDNAKARGEAQAAERDLRHEIRRAVIEQKWDQATRLKLVEYINKYLPPDARGKYLGRVAKTNKPKDLTRVFFDVQKDAWNLANKALIKDINVLTDRLLESKSFPVAVKKQIREMFEGIRRENWSARTVDQIRAQQALIDAARASGEDVTVPQALHDQVAKLGMRPINEMPPEDLEAILSNLKYLAQQGRDIRQAIADLEEINRLQDVLEIGKGASKLDYASTARGKKRRFGDPLMSWADENKNKWLKAVDWFQDIGVYISPIQVIVDEEGAAARRILYDPLQDGHIRFVSAFSEFLERVKVHIEKDLGGKPFTAQEQERITTVFMREQRGGREKMHQLGVGDDYIDSIKLTDREKTAYKLRDEFKKVQPALERFHAKTNNKEFIAEENYYPMMTDHDAAPDKDFSAEKMVSEYLDIRRKNVNQGQLKERVEGAKQKIRTDVYGVLFDGMRRAFMIEHMAEPILRASARIKDPAYREMAGDLRQGFWKDYLDTLARDGKFPRSSSEWWLDYFRKNLGVAALTFKPQVAAIQISSLANGATVVGGNNLRRALSAGGAWDDFVDKNMPLIYNRAGGDPSVHEAVRGETVLGPMARKGFKHMVATDLWTARKVALAAYFQYHEVRGLTPDIENPNQQALAYAQSVPGKVMASPWIIDMPLALSRGGPIVKAMFQYQSETLSKFGILTHQIFGSGRKSGAEAAQDAMWLGAAAIYETGVRSAWTVLAMGSLLAIGAIDEEQYERAVNKSDLLYKQVLSSALGAIPIVGKVADVVRYNSTGLPVADVAKDVLEGAANLVDGVVNEKPIKAVKGLTQTLTAAAMLAGVPGSGIAGWFLKQPLRGKRDKPKKKTSQRSPHSSSRRGAR